MKKITALILTLSLIFCFAACGKTEAEEESTTDVFSETYTDYQSTDTATEPITQATQPATETTTEIITQAPVTSATEAPVTEAPATYAPVTEAAVTTQTYTAEPSKAEILKTLSDAVNKTKEYKGAITVNHEESFDITEPAVTLDNAQGISTLATKAVNFVKDLVLKPSSEVYSFSNGIATTSENEQTQLLLPKDKAFCLTEDGVNSATITDENGKKHIKMTLNAEETHSLSEAPKYNSSAIGYLNLDGEFNIIQIDTITIGYPGSTIDAVIREDGYVESITYVINLKADVKAHGMGISGSAAFSGSQTEVWNINW